MWMDFEGAKHRPLRSPAMVVAVSTSIPQYKALYSQAREAAAQMMKRMNLENVGTVRSSAFPPEVLVRDDGAASLPECGFYAYRGKHDFVLFAGDSSPMEEQYEFANFVLGKAKEMGVKELYSIGARWAENPLPPEADPLVSGFATDSVGVAKLRKHGVRILSEEPAPFFASLVVAMAADFGIRGYKLSVDHGEPSPHPRSVTRLLNVLGSILGFELDLSELHVKAPQIPAPGQDWNSAIYQ